MKSKFYRISLIAMATAIGVAQPALAQDTGGAADAGAATNTGGLDQILVTAQRREENLQRAAISVTAISSDDLTRQGVTDVNQLRTFAPALQVANSYGPTNQFTLRGIGNVVLNVNIDGPVTTNLDGVPIARGTSVHGLFFDLERIEVLKGPQGTLYGRNATGGAINIITRAPQIGELSGNINASYGNYDALNVNGAINLPVSDNAALRIAGSVSQHDGYYSDGTGDERIRAVRGAFRAELSDTFTVTLGGDFAHAGGVGSGATVFRNDRDARIGILDPRSIPVYTSTLSFPTFSFLNPLTERDYQDNQMWGVYLNAEIETAVGTITVLPSYRRTDLDYLTSAGSFYAQIDEVDEQTSLEVRLVSDSSGPLQYILGGFYMQEDSESNVGFNQQFFGAYGLFNPSSEAYAGYARLTYELTPEFRLTAGGRYTTDKRSTFQDVPQAIVICPGANPANPATYCIGTPSLPNGVTAPANWVNPAGGYFPVVPLGTSGALAAITYTGTYSDSRTFNRFDWRLGVEYDIGEQSLFYATFETGFKAGGFFSSPDPVKTFDPETVDAFTVGTKNRFLDNRLQLNLEGFWWTYKGKHFSRIVPTSTGTTFATTNVGQSRVRGIELDVLGAVTDTTTLNLNIQYLDATETDFQYDALAALGPPVTGCSFPAAPTGGLYRVNCSGMSSVNAPEWTINAGFEQIFPLANGAEVAVNGQTRYQSSANTSYDFFAVGVQKGYFMSDLSVTYNAPGDAYYVSAFVNNIEDAAAVTYTQQQPRSSVPLLFRYSLTPPRTYGLRVGMEF